MNLNFLSCHYLCACGGMYFQQDKKQIQNVTVKFSLLLMNMNDYELVLYDCFPKALDDVNQENCSLQTPLYQLSLRTMVLPHGTRRKSPKSLMISNVKCPVRDGTSLGRSSVSWSTKNHAPRTGGGDGLATSCNSSDGRGPASTRWAQSLKEVRLKNMDG